VHRVDDFTFVRVSNIQPELDDTGRLKSYTPHSRYSNLAALPLHEYGAGPFCRFSISSEWKGKEGVYIFLVNDIVKYVGECVDLAARITTGYGNISPRNCFKDGQPTNCRINNLVLESVKQGYRITLIFHETKERLNVEAKLLRELRPEWNATLTGHTGQQIRKRTPTLNINKVPMPRLRGSCRDEVVEAARAIIARKRRNEFRLIEITQYLKNANSEYSESTIRTHVASRCCANAPDHHAKVYRDFERIGEGMYRVVREDE